MRTDDLRPSSNVEDDCEASASRGISGGAGGLSIGAVIIIGLISWYFGIDPSVLLNGYQNLTSGNSGSEQTVPRLRQSRPGLRTIRLACLSP